MNRHPVVWLFAVLVMALSLGHSETLFAGEEFIITGNEWIESPDGHKDAFLVGMATIIDVEQEYQGKNPAKNSSIPTLAKGLGNLTLAQIKQAINEYYQKNPTQLDRPVMYVVWDLAVNHVKKK